MIPIVVGLLVALSVVGFALALAFIFRTRPGRVDLASPSRAEDQPTRVYVDGKTYPERDRWAHPPEAKR